MAADRGGQVYIIEGFIRRLPKAQQGVMLE